MSNVIDDILDSILPKKLWVKHDYFEIVIIKRDHYLTFEDSVVAMYAEPAKSGHLTNNYLLKRKGGTLTEAVESLNKEYAFYCEYLETIGGNSNLRKGYWEFSKERFEEDKKRPWTKIGKLYKSKNNITTN